MCSITLRHAVSSLVGLACDSLLRSRQATRGFSIVHTLAVTPSNRKVRCSCNTRSLRKRRVMARNQRRLKPSRELDQTGWWHPPPSVESPIGEPRRLSAVANFQLGAAWPRGTADGTITRPSRTRLFAGTAMVSGNTGHPLRTNRHGQPYG